MKITFERKNLLEAVTIAVRATSDTAGQEILGHVLVEVENGKFSITGHDTVLALKAICSGTATKDGKFTLSGQLFREMIAACDADQVELDFTGKTSVHITSGEYESRLPTLPAVNYPPMPVVTQGSAWMTVNANDFRKAVKRVAFAVAVGSGREALNGFLLDSTCDIVSLIATDTHKVGYSQFEPINSSGPITVVVPARAFKDLLALMPTGDGETVTIQCDDKILCVELPNATFTSMLIQDNYVSWKNAVPLDFERYLTLKRDEFLGALHRAQILAQFSGNYVAVKMKKDRIIVSTKDQKGVSGEAVVCDYDGAEDIEMFFDVKDAMSGLQALESSDVKLHMNGVDKLVKVVGSGLEDECYQVWAPLVPR